MRKKIGVSFLLLFGIVGSILAQNRQEEVRYTENSFYDGTSVLVPDKVSDKELVDLASKVRPSARQLRWQQYEMLGFVHFNLNTFTGMQWGSGVEDLTVFNPEELDAKQWVETFKSAGIKSVILVCKHHDGLTLWPSQFRERTIAKTPWRDGQGDLVREFMDACREEGIRTCIYYSPWDKQDPYGTPTYNDLMVNELTELLTNYGNIDLVWFDGAGLDEKTSGVKMEIDWPRVYALIRELQPQALISGAAPDIRWVGNEAGRGRFTEWSVQGVDLMEADFSGADAGTALTAKKLGDISELSRFKQLAWYPARGGLPVRVQWFWAPNQQSRSLEYMINSYFETVGQNSNVLINLSPDQRGLIPEEDVRLMKQFGKYLERMYAKNHAEGAVAKATEVREGGFAANYLFDDDLRTCWLAPEGQESGVIRVDLYGKQTFNVIKLSENIADYGQRVERFEVDAWKEDKWQKIGEASTIGLRRLLVVPITTTNKIRIRITDSRTSPSLASLELYTAPEIKKGPKIERDERGKVKIFNEGKKVQYTLDGSDPLLGEKHEYNGPFSLPHGGEVRAAFVGDESGEFFQHSQEVFSILPLGWKVKGAKDGKRMIDGDEHTWVDIALLPSGEADLEILLPEVKNVSGFGYLPPQGASNEPGRVSLYEFYLMTEEGKWKKVSEGNFGNVDNNPVERRVDFGASYLTEKVKMVIKQTSRQDKVARVAEFKLY
ncbi:hypothetical protein GCM10028791_20470 [Echinicola sediminis]